MLTNKKRKKLNKVACAKMETAIHQSVHVSEDIVILTIANANNAVACSKVVTVLHQRMGAVTLKITVHVIERIYFVGLRHV